MRQSRIDASLAYHAARLIILVRFCGKPQNSAVSLPGILGRTLLAKLDFFLRYPAYLKRARELLRVHPPRQSGSLDVPETTSIESRMVRYLYGPWDHVYYPTLAYLIGKRLIQVEPRRQAEMFRLTERGMDVADQLATDNSYLDLSERARIVNSLFHAYTGTGVKNFIYEHFPEIVGRQIGEAI